LCLTLPSQTHKKEQQCEERTSRGLEKPRQGTTGNCESGPSYRPAGEQQEPHYPGRVTISQHHKSPHQESNVDEVRDSSIRNTPPSSVNETRHNLQRRFGGKQQTPHTASWVAQRIHEEKEESSIGILLAWTHLRRYQEVTPDTIDLLNSLPDTDAVEALKELKQPKKYVQGIGGNKLSTKVVVKTHNELVDTIALIDSGCTGSCVHSRFVKKHKIPTRKLP